MKKIIKKEKRKMTKKEILQASADSLEAISKELQEMAFRNAMNFIFEQPTDESKAYVMIGDAASALTLIRAAILSAKDHIED